MGIYVKIQMKGLLKNLALGLLLLGIPIALQAMPPQPGMPSAPPGVNPALYQAQVTVKPTNLLVQRICHPQYPFRKTAFLSEFLKCAPWNIVSGTPGNFWSALIRKMPYPQSHHALGGNYGTPAPWTIF